MNRCDIMELHYIAPIANVPSIIKHGILSHTLACKIVHNSVAMPEIQERRKNKQIPGVGEGDGDGAGAGGCGVGEKQLFGATEP